MSSPTQLNFEKLIRFDSIRISKLLEQIQFTIIVFFIAFFIGSMTDKLFPLNKTPDQTTDYELIRDLLLQLILIVITAYYIMKIAHVIPFFFSLSDKYVPSAHGESSAGGSLAMAIIFVGVQKNFQARLSLLKSRYYP